MKNRGNVYYYCGKKIYQLLYNGDCDTYTLTGELLSCNASLAMDCFVPIGEFETVEQAVDKVMEMGYKYYEDFYKVCPLLQSKKKYYMYSRYEFYPDENGNRDDFVHIGVASAEDIQNDGTNWVGGGESVDFAIYDTLKEAVLGSSMIICGIDFIDLSDAEMKEVEKLKEELMNDEEYLARFNRKLHDTVFTVYNQETKETEECVLYKSEHANMLKVGNIVDYRNRNKAFIASGVIVNKERRRINYMEETCKYLHLDDSRNEKQFFIITDKEAAIEEDDCLPFY